ncbi:MAG: sugar ABC transporter permease [Treponema sp.]|jgi:raffinose/stachyose/melibiose transport system permease protein|nr:sugar ABC transporter permease [Treponema sp.]
MIFKKKKPLILFLVPAFAFMIVYLFYPFVMNIINSFSDIPSLGASSKGFLDPWFTNYARLATDPYMKTAFINTMLMMLSTIVFQVGIAMILALLMDTITKKVEFFRTVYFFPIVISATALGLLFNLVFMMQGPLNQILASMGLVDMAKPIIWKEEHWMFTMFTPVVWQYVGYYFVIIATGLNNISADVYEAAQIDGAKGLQVVFRIKLPLLFNTIATCITLAITGALKVFDLPWTMFPRGIPMEKSWLAGTYMYRFSLGGANNIGYSSAIAVFIVILGVVLSQLMNTILKEKDY